MLLELDLKRFDFVVMAVVSVVLFRAHEGVALWGGAAFASAVLMLYWRDHLWVSNKNLHVYTLGLVSLAQFSFVLFWQKTHPETVKATNSFFQLITKYSPPGELWSGNTRISVLTVIFISLAFLYYLISKKSKETPILIVSLFVVAFFITSFYIIIAGISVWYDYELINPVREYQYRFLMPFCAPIWMLVATAFVSIGMLHI